MITTNFSLWRGVQGRGVGDVLCDPNRLHKSALFKWANIIWSAALWSIIPDSYPSQERDINHKEKTFLICHPHSPAIYTHAHTHACTRTCTRTRTHTFDLAKSHRPSFRWCPVPGLSLQFSLDGPEGCDFATMLQSV